MFRCLFLCDLFYPPISMLFQWPTRKQTKREYIFRFFINGHTLVIFISNTYIHMFSYCIPIAHIIAGFFGIKYSTLPCKHAIRYQEKRRFDLGCVTTSSNVLTSNVQRPCLIIDGKRGLVSMHVSFRSRNTFFAIDNFSCAVTIIKDDIGNQYGIL